MVRTPLLAGCALALACATAKPAARAAQPVAYVSNEGDGTVTIIDLKTDAVLGSIHVGKRPRGLKVSADGTLLFVALSGSPRMGPGADEAAAPPPDRTADGIAVVDLAERKVRRVLESGDDPESFDLSADGKRLFVSNEDAGKLSVVDVESGKVVAQVPVGEEPEGVTVRPDGRVVYVTCESAGAVFAVDTTTYAVLAKVRTGHRPRSVAFTADSALAFVSNENDHAISVVDAQTHAPVATVTLAGEQARPMGLALGSGGRELFVSNGRGTTVAVVDVARREVVRTIADVGVRPWGLGLNAEGTRLYTANGPSNDVSVIDVATGKVVKRIPAGELPWGVAIAR